MRHSSENPLRCLSLQSNEATSPRCTWTGRSSLFHFDVIKVGVTSLENAFLDFQSTYNQTK